MNQLRTTGIVLARVDYGEADRIVTMLTSDAGKLSLIAKGVRRVKSKLAGGIELFSVSELVYIPGKGTIDTLVSTRLIRHYSHIVQDIDRTMLGYELLRQVHKTTEEDVEPEYFDMLDQSVALLDDSAVPMDFVQAWFSAQLLKHTGHTPNFTTDTDGEKLAAGKRYNFNFEHVALERAQGTEALFDTDTIKFCRLLFSGSSARALYGVTGSEAFAAKLLPLMTSLRQYYLSV